MCAGRNTVADNISAFTFTLSNSTAGPYSIDSSSSDFVGDFSARNK